MDARALLTAVLTRKGAELSAKNRATLEDLAKRATDSAGSVQDIADELAALITPADDGGANSITGEQRAAVAALGEDATPDKVAELRRNAEAGAKYRESVIGGIVSARTAAALGPDGKSGLSAEEQEAIRATLRNQSISDLEALAQLWGGAKRERFTPGSLLRFPEVPEGVRSPEGNSDEIGGGFLSIREG